MLAWLAMFAGANLGMQSSLEQYQEIKKTKFPKEILDEEMSKDLARADDGFAIAPVVSKQFFLPGVGD